MIEHVKTAALVLAVTVLIWVWAEAESLSTQTLTPRLELVGSQSLLVKPVTPGWTGSVTVRLRGATASLDRAQRALVQAVRLSAGAGGIPTSPGEHLIDLRDALRADPEFRRAGVTIDEVQPATLTVLVQTIEERVLPIRLRLVNAAGQPVEMEGEPTLSVASALVRGPADLVRQLADSAAVMGVVEPDQVSRLRDDQPQTVTARLALPEPVASSASASVSPERVSAVVRLRSRTETWSLASVPVWIAIPPTEGDQWEIELVEPFLAGVRFTGPKEAIASLRERADLAVAYVNLTSDDLERAAASDRGVVSKRVVFSSVSGAVQVDAPRTTVDVRVKRRVPATSPEGGPGT
jgi:hypothetical protein